MKKALISGASGLVGNLLVNQLLNDPYFDEIEILARRSIGFKRPGLKEKLIDFDDLPNIDKVDATHLFCCLGTTIKKAGSREAFQKVDHEYVEELAKLAERSGVEKFLVISSIGAAKNSLNFYLRTKGEMEESIKSTHIPAIFIFHPSFLIGKRKEFRLGELFGTFLIRFVGLLFIGKLKKYKAINATVVAHAMLHSAKVDKHGIFVIESDQIAEIVRYKYDSE